MAAKKLKAVSTKKQVLVTTEHRGVFIGTMADPSPHVTEASLEDAVMVIYWGTTKGLAQLAAEGPTSTTRASSLVPKWHVRKITSVIELGDVAAQAWAAKIGSAK